MKIDGADVTFTIGTRAIRVVSVEYGDEREEAAPDLIVANRADYWNAITVERPHPVIRDALSDRVDDIVMRYPGDGNRLARRAAAKGQVRR